MSSSTVWLAARNLLSKPKAFIFFPHFLFLIPVCSMRLLWKLPHDFLPGSQSGCTLAWVGRQWGIPRALISDGAPLFAGPGDNCVRGNTVQCECREGHSVCFTLWCLHTLPATDDVIYHQLQKTPITKTAQWPGRLFFQKFWRNIQNNLSENTNQWVQLRKKKLMADKQLKRELFGYLASFTTSLCLKLLASHTCKHLRFFFFFCIILLACLEILVETDYFQTHKD